MARFRKGKKAFKAGKVNAHYYRYLGHLERIRQQKELAMKGIFSSLNAMMGINKIATIQGYQGATKLQKALMIAEQVIYTAQQIQRIWNP